MKMCRFELNFILIFILNFNVNDRLFTFGRVKTERLTVRSFTATVKGFNSSVVQRIEMQAVHCTDGLLTTVDLLLYIFQKEKSVRNYWFITSIYLGLITILVYLWR